MPFKLEPLYFERYIDLVCRFKHSHVQILDFLKQHLGMYIPQSLLVIVAKYKVREVECYLHEVSGNVESAFSIHMELLHAVMQHQQQQQEQKVHEGVTKTLKFLHQHQSSFSAEQTNTFWFKLLDVILDKQVELTKKLRSSLSSPPPLDKCDNKIESKETVLGSSDSNAPNDLGIDFLKRMTSIIMTSAMPHLSPGSILERIISSCAYAKGEFGELRGVLMSMMETCSYERVLMVASRDLACSDLHDLKSQLVRLSRKGSSFRPNQHCTICFDPLFRPPSNTSSSDHSSNSNVESLLLFSCQHFYHLSCLQKISFNDGLKLSHEALSGNCYLCSNKNPHKVVKVKSERLEQQEIDKILSEQSLSTPLPSPPTTSFSLSLSQFLSFKKVRKAQKSPSNMAVFNDLKSSSSSSSSFYKVSSYAKSHQNFKPHQSAFSNQKLAPPIPLSHRS